MLKAKGLPGVFWGEAVTTVVYLLSRSSSKSTSGKTPYELWTGSPPGVHHLRTFGCVAHVKVTTPNLKKLDDRSRRMIFVGYEPGSKAYRVYDPATRRVHISRDVVFDEAAQWTWTEGHGGTAKDFVVEDSIMAPPGVITTTSTSARISAGTAVSPLSSPASSQVSPVHDTGSTTPSPQAHQGDAPIEFVSPPGVGAYEMLDADHDDEAPLRFRDIDNVLGPATSPGLVARELEEQLLLTSDAEPTSFAEAQEHENWRHAMLDEFTSIEANGTWELVEPPPRLRPIGLKWVYKTKRDEAGLVAKYKARLVAKGYVQRQGIDYDEVFAPMARLESVRLLLAYAASEGWAVHHMDVKSAFLNGELREDVYVEQPPRVRAQRA